MKLNYKYLIVYFSILLVLMLLILPYYQAYFNDAKTLLERYQTSNDTYFLNEANRLKTNGYLLLNFYSSIIVSLAATIYLVVLDKVVKIKVSYRYFSYYLILSTLIFLVVLLSLLDQSNAPKLNAFIGQYISPFLQLVSVYVISIATSTKVTVKPVK